jgi:hypothetical protein
MGYMSELYIETMQYFDEYKEYAVETVKAYHCISDDCLEQPYYETVEDLRHHYLKAHAYIVTCCGEQLLLSDEWGLCPTCKEGMF